MALEIPVPLPTDETGVHTVSELIALLDDVIEVMVEIPMPAVPVVIGTELEEPVSGEFEDAYEVVRFRVTVEVKVEIEAELVGEYVLLEITIDIELLEAGRLSEL